MIGFIKKIFNGILSFLGGLLQSKKVEELKEAVTSLTEKPANNGKKQKRNGYFMELNEAEEKQSVNGNQPAKVEVNRKEKAEAAKTPVSATVAKTTNKTAKQEPNKTNKQESAEKTQTIEQASKKAEQVAKKVELVQTAEGVKVEPKKPTSASPTANSNGQKLGENTFAPKYLTPSSSNSRRRPGPSMNNFLDMARQVKTPG